VRGMSDFTWRMLRYAVLLRGGRLGCLSVQWIPHQRKMIRDADITTSTQPRGSDK
jgi:hypothetical protein